MSADLPPQHGTLSAHHAPGYDVVAGGHAETVAAAVAVLEAGGNAFDAAVAAGFAAAVAEPCLSSLAGGGFLLARPAHQEPVVFDFFVDTPGRGAARNDPPSLTPATVVFGGAEQVFHVGPASIAVPGCLAGYLHVHRRLGRLPLAEVITPARRLAADGVVLGAGQAAVVRLLEPIFSLTPEARSLFVPGDRPFSDHDEVTNPQLARFLDAIGTGEVTGFDDPQVAAAIVAENQDAGGTLTQEDLRAYQVVERTPLTTRHAGARVLTNPPPSYGGALITRALSRLAERGLGGPPRSLERLARLARVLAEVTDGHRRGAGASDPGTAATSVAAAGRGPGGAAAPGSGTHLEDGRPRAAKGTTHVSVVDREGNLASMTTSNGSGSGIALGDTGVLANNIMGEADLHPGGFHRSPAGVRVGSMMAPTVVLPDVGPPIALGSGGSERIRSALTQVLVGLLDDQLALGAAIRAPRLHWDGTWLQVEPGFEPQVVAALGASWPVNVWQRTDLYFGGVHAVAADGARVGDPRRGGCTATVGDDGA